MIQNSDLAYASTYPVCHPAGLRVYVAAKAQGRSICSRRGRSRIEVVDDTEAGRGKKMERNLRPARMIRFLPGRLTSAACVRLRLQVQTCSACRTRCSGHGCQVYAPSSERTGFNVPEASENLITNFYCSNRFITFNKIIIL